MDNANVTRVRERLLSTQPNDKIAIWKIVGEDPNCDWGGHHHQPELGTYQGKYEDVVDYALSLSAFFTWGSGGDIKEIKIQPLTPETTKEIKQLNNELKKLNKRKQEIEDKLKTLEG